MSPKKSSPLGDALNHSELIVASATWAEKRRYRVVLRDVQCIIVSEQPDVIGWKSHGSSLLIECKASRSDFLRDKKKSWRRHAEEGMGYERYYAVPTGVGVIDLEDLSAEVGGWGVITIDPKHRVTVLKKSGPFTKRNDRAERALLVSAVCRVTEGWGRKIFGPDAPLAADGDPPPSTAKVIRELRAENLKLRHAIRLANS